jgi:hypothetical protein
VGQDCTQAIPIDVLDRDTGASIVPLTAEALRAKTGDTALPVIALNRIRTSRIIVLIDESGSMGGSESPEIHLDQALRPIKQTLSELMEDLPPGVSIGYGLFNDKWLFSDGFVSDPNELRRRVEDVTLRFGKMGHGKTALYDSLHEALLNLGTPQLTDTILLLTDGGDNSSQRSAKQLEHEFRVAGARLLTMIVYLSQVHGALSPSEIDQRDSVQALVSNTGGSSLAVNGARRYWIDKKASAAYVQLVRYFWQHQVLARYTAYVQVPAALRNEQKWKLWLNSDADPRLKHGVVVYPNRLSPCPVTVPPS